MRIKTVTIFGFGKWHDQTIDLATDYQVLFGQNEAGKSTLTALIKGILFGFASGKQRYEQYRPKNGAQYGGELLVEYQQRTLIIRRIDGKFGGDVTVVDQGNEFGADYLATMLAPADETLFTQIFETNQQDLNQIFGLKQADFLQHLLTIGAVGSHEWLGFANELDKASQKIYKPSGRKWPLNQALKQYPELVQTVKAASSGYHDYEVNQQALQTAQANQMAQSTQIKQLQTKQTQAQRLIERWPHYQELQTLQTTLAHTPAFDQTDYEQYQQLTEQLAAVTSELKTATTKIEAVQATLDQTGEFRFYQAHETEITALFEQLAQQQKNLTILKLKQAQLTQLAAEQAQLMAQYQWELPLPTPLTAEEVTKYQAALEQAQQLTTDIQVMTSQLDSLATQITTQTQLVNQLEQQNTPNQQSLTRYWVVGGLLLLTLFLPSLFKIGALIGFGLLGYAGYQRQQSQKQVTQQATQKQTWQTALAQLDMLKDQQHTQQSALAAMQRQLIELQQERAAMQKQHDYPDTTSLMQIINCQSDLRRVSQLTNEVQVQTTAIETLEGQLLTYCQQWQFAKAWVGSLQATDEQNLAQIETFKVRIQKMNQDLAQSNESYQYYQTQVERLKAKQTTLQQAQAQHLAQAQVTTAAELTQRYEKEQVRQQNQQRYADLEAELAQFLPALAQIKDLAQLKADFEATQTQLATANTELQRQQQMIAELTLAQQQLIDNDQYQRLRQTQLQAEANITDLAQDWLANQLAIDWIQATLKAASQERFPRILTKATHYFELLTQQRYCQINLDAEVMSVLRADQVLFEVGELSQGTAEQLYIALRFAFAEEIADVVSLPLLIDDGFVNFDDQRQAAIWQLLQELSAHHQVIYLTANPRTEAAFGADHWLNLEKVGQ